MSIEQPHPGPSVTSPPRGTTAPKVVVIAEFYPRRNDPVLGVWAHRQALASVRAGAEVQVIVLHRLVPPKASLAGGPAAFLKAWGQLLRQPHHEIRDGLPVTYVRYVSPPRDRSYSAWGAWAAPALALALRRLRASFAFDLIHAHNAVPAADAARRARMRSPLIVSVHGSDVLYTAPRARSGGPAVRRGLSAARLVLANSQPIADLASAWGATRTRVVHLGADPPSASVAGPVDPRARPHLPRLRASAGGHGLSNRTLPPPTLVTVAHLIARKRHGDVIRALAVLGDRHPTLRYEIVGDGPERAALVALALRLGVSDRVSLLGQLPNEQALRRVALATMFVMPSIDEAFGVAYIEAMAHGVPAIGCRGEPGPEEIAAAGEGLILVPPADIERLTQRIDELLSDPQRLLETGMRARATVAANFTWERCGAQTVAAYREALR